MGGVSLLLMFNTGNVLMELWLLFFHKRMEKNENRSWNKKKWERESRKLKRVSGRDKGWNVFCLSSERKSLKGGGEVDICIFRAVQVAWPLPFGSARALGVLSRGGARRNTGLWDLPDLTQLESLVGQWLMIASDSQIPSQKSSNFW